MKLITLQEMQQIELNLLIEFDKVCKKHGLRYYMDGGTLLGAMCYEGFIPWDDDVDLKMPRADYDRFLHIAAEFPAYITMEVPSKESCPHLFLKLIDNRTVLLEQARGRINHSGVYIDIFPMDGHPDNKEDCKEHFKKLSRYNSLFHFAQSGFAELRSSASIKNRCKGYLYAAVYSPWRLYRKLTAVARKYSYDECDKVGLLIEGDPVRERFEKAWLEPPIELAFEGHYFLAPSGYRQHMEIFYGDHVTKPECYHNLPQYPGTHEYEAFWKE